MDSSSSVGKSDGARASRRVWSVAEEAALAAGLRELVVRGYKADNSFKPGYAKVLEQHMRQALPGTDLRADPHINSKIHVWKKYYASLALMQSISGFGWDDTTNMFTVDTKEIWEAHIKADPAAKPMRHKSWPFFKDWIEIFGKDRATGENAQGFADVVNNLIPNRGQNVPRSPPHTIHEGQDEGHGGGSSSTTHGASSSVPIRKKGKKRKAMDATEERFLSIMDNFCSKTDERLASLAQRIGFEHDTREQRIAVFDALKNIHFLTVEQRMTVCKKICMSNVDLDMFFSIGDEYKTVMVRMIHEGRF